MGFDLRSSDNLPLAFMIHDRIPPRDGERIDDDSCPDCFHLKEECVCDVHLGGEDEIRKMVQDLSGIGTDRRRNNADSISKGACETAQTFPECSSAHTEPNTQQGQMRVLVACEFSGIVRDSFTALGHDAWSCDLLPCERAGNHIQGDVLSHLEDGWDLMVAHPPCTHLAVSGARWFETKQVEQRKAIYFFLALANAPINKICIENPISIMSTQWRKPDQIIQPWQFGHGETKATCLWLKNLPKLTPTNIVKGREARVHREPPSPERWKNRSRTLQGISDAMAAQWSNPNTKKPFDDRTESTCEWFDSLPKPPEPLPWLPQEKATDRNPFD